MTTKRCITCGETKPLSEFYKDDTHKDGYRKSCKKCIRNKKIEYSRTKEGLISKLYRSHKYRSNKYRYGVLEYTKQELKEWLFAQDRFHELYDEWVRSGYDEWKVPSVDRIDDYKGYAFDNIQLMTWKENNLKSHADRKNGINNKISKAVLQYDLDGNFIKKYYSIMQIERETKMNNGFISKVCNGIYKQAYGFVWKFN